MTVSSSINKAGPYAGAGTTGPFTVTYRFLSASHLRVIKTSTAGLDTVLTLTTDYTVSGVGNPTGSVTLTAPLAVGEKLTIIRDVPFTQEADYVANDPFPAESHETALDLAVMRDQQIKERLDVALTLPPTVTGVSTTLPTPIPNGLVAWNASANALQTVDSATLGTIVTYGTARAETFVGNGVQTVFTLAENPGALANLDISIGGVTQIPTADYVWSGGTTLTMTAPVPNGQTMLVRYMNALPQGTMDASAVTFTQSGSGVANTDVRTVLREAISVTHFQGFTGNGVADDRAAVLAAAVEARNTGKALYCPRGFTVRLSAATDLTGIKYIRFESPIVIPTGTLTVGGFFNSGGGRIEFDNVTNGTSVFLAPPVQPVLRVTGVSESFVSVGSCNFLQLYADSAVSENRAVSYNQFRITGGVTLLGITDSGAALSYVNENFIYGDRIERVSIVGVGYPHNHNKLFHPCMEGSNVTLTFNNCYMNQVYGARFESVSAAPGVSFNSTAYCNTVMFTWSGAGSPEDQFRIAIPVTDSGRGNMVTSEPATQFHKTQAFAVGPNSGMVGTATSFASADPRIAPATFGLFVNGGPSVITPSLLGFTPTTFEFIALSDPIPVQLGDVVSWDVDFDGSILRPVVYVLDSQMRPLTSEGGGGAFYQQTDVTTLDATYGFYSSATALSAAQMRPGSIRRSEVAFVRIGGYLSTAGFMRYFSASVYSQAMNRGKTEGEAARRYQFMTIDGAPTRGYVQQGTAVYDRVTKVMRFCTRAQESTLTAALSAGATSATVASGTGLANGDIVGILLDNQTTHWTSVSGLTGNTFTIAAIPAGRSAPINGRVVFNRWSS